MRKSCGGVGVEIFSFSPRDHKKILWWGWAWNNFNFYHETKRFTKKVQNAIGK